ncbi:MAG: protein kinase [Planctomycetota bacterium]
MSKPKRTTIDDALLKRFAAGKLDSELEMKLALAIEKSPKLQARMAAVSSDGFLEKVKEVAAVGQLSQAIQSAQPRVEAKLAERADAGLKGVPQELAESTDYEVIRELGRGGMGVVYLAKYLPMDRPEVLKVLNAEMVRRESARQRFVTEMRAIGKLNHPAIATAYQQVPLQTQLVFSMEYVPGMDLHKFIAKYRPIPIAAACTIASQIAGALQHAHKRKMVHRDIKPSNVMVFKEDGQRQIKILDFGLAKASSEQEAVGLTADGTMLGTPEYMAPEQALDAATADIRADIYSLGCTLYHMLVGRPPFTGTYQSVLMSHATKEADYISLERTDVPVELSEIVAKMMAKEPKKRYQNPNEAAAALKPFCGAAQVTKTAKPSDAKIDTAIDLASPSRDTSIEGPPQPKEAAQPKQSTTNQDGVALDDVAQSLADLKVTPRQTTRTRKNTKTKRHASKPRRQSKSRKLLTAIGVIALLGMLYTATLVLKTKHGTLVIENLPPDAVVTVDGQTASIENVEAIRGGKAILSVAQGKRAIEVKANDLVVHGETVSVSSGRVTPITVSFVDADKELLQNPSCEAEPVGERIPGWQVEEGNWSRVNWDKWGEVKPVDGRWFFGADSVPLAVLSQTVSLGSNRTRIANGELVAKFVGFVHVDEHSNRDAARVVIDFLGDSSNDILASYDSGEYTKYRWGRLEHFQVVPSKTRFIRIRLIAKRLGGVANQGIFDNLSIKISEAGKSPESVSKPNKETTSNLASQRIESEVFVSEKSDWRVEPKVEPELLQQGDSWGNFVMFGSEEWSDYKFSFEAMKVGGELGQHGSFGCTYRGLGNDTYHSWRYGSFANAEWTHVVIKVDDNRKNPPNSIIERTKGIVPNRWYKIDVVVKGNSFKCFVDGKLTLDYEDENILRGRVGLSSGGPFPARFRRVTVSSLDGETLWSGLPDLPVTGMERVSNPVTEAIETRQVPKVEQTSGTSLDPAESTVVSDAASDPATLETDSASSQSWETLFSGTHLNAWRSRTKTNQNWRIQDGLLIGAGKGSGITTIRNDFQYFELIAEIALRGGVNSGIVFGPQDARRECELAIPSSSKTHALGSIIGKRPWPRVQQRVSVGRGDWFTLKLTNAELELRVSINDRVVVKVPGVECGPGSLSLANWHDAGEIAIRSMKIRGL